MANQASFWTACRNTAIARIVRAAREIARPELMIVLAIIGAALVTPSIAMQGDTIADRVLGQVDFVHNGLNLIDATGMLNPQSVAIDSTVTPNRLYVSDSGNSRVLGYHDVATFVNGGAADGAVLISQYPPAAPPSNLLTRFSPTAPAPIAAWRMRARSETAPSTSPTIVRAASATARASMAT